MFALFYDLYMALFTGTWIERPLNQIFGGVSQSLNYVGKLVTSIFNNVAEPYETFGSDFIFTSFDLISFILALITSIGVFVAVVNIIKRIFTIFFQGVR